MAFETLGASFTFSVGFLCTQIDYDENIWDMQKLVEQKYKKIEEHERLIQRKREEVNKGNFIQVDLLCNQRLVILRVACLFKSLLADYAEGKERTREASSSSAC